MENDAVTNETAFVQTLPKSKGRVVPFVEHYISSAA